MTGGELGAGAGEGAGLDWGAAGAEDPEEELLEDEPALEDEAPPRPRAPGPAGAGSCGSALLVVAVDVDGRGWPVAALALLSECPGASA